MGELISVACLCMPAGRNSVQPMDYNNLLERRDAAKVLRLLPLYFSARCAEVLRVPLRVFAAGGVDHTDVDCASIDYFTLEMEDSAGPGESFLVGSTPHALSR